MWKNTAQMLQMELKHTFHEQQTIRICFQNYKKKKWLWHAHAQDILFLTSRSSTYVRKSISELQIQVATYVFELSAGNCHR
jgi:hypothetical protein